MKIHILPLLIIVVNTATSFQCNGKLNVSILYGDAQIERVQLEGVNLFTAFPVTTSYSISLPPAIANSQAGENGILFDEEHYRYFLPLGNVGKRIVALFDGATISWTNIDVYCEPIGLAVWSPGKVVGFCSFNATHSCVPYFILANQEDNSWVDVSGPGLCSHSLSTSNLTNPVILQFYTQYGYAVKLYFAEQGTNILHEIDLAQQETMCYDVPDYGDSRLRVNRLVSAVATDASFTGLRLESSIDNSPGVYHILFSSTAVQSFSQTIIQTETIAFDSGTLDCLVSFTANRKTMIVLSEDGTTRQYELAVALDDPIQCENMFGSLICLAGGGLSPILINVNGTSQIIPSGDSLVTRIGKLTKNVFYLLNTQQQMLFYALGSDLVYLGRFAVHSDNLRIMSIMGDITCDTVQITKQHGYFPTAVLVILLVLLVAVLWVSVGVIIYVVRRKRKENQYVRLSDNSSTSSDTSTNGDPITLEVPDEHMEENNTQRSAPMIHQCPTNQGNSIQPLPGLSAANPHADITGYDVDGSEVVEPKECSSGPAPISSSHEREPPIGGPQSQEHLIVIPGVSPVSLQT